MAGLFGRGNLGKELPRPRPTTTLLAVTGLLGGLGGLAACAWVLVQSERTPQHIALAAALLVGGLLAEGLALGLTLVVKYAFSAAVSAKLTERTLRDILQRTGADSPQAEPSADASHEVVVSLLTEIMENSLLDEGDKVAKRELAKRQRRRALKREIGALIEVGKYPEAKERLDDFRFRYHEKGEADALQARLEEALAQHGRTEVEQIIAEIQEYMSLALWDRAVEMADRLAEQYPENAEAVKLPETVRIEKAASQRQEQQRVYREIEHLASRKHWRQAIEASQHLIETHPESPEAAKLRQQMDELKHNADVVERREWEGRITEHIQAGRHLMAYNLAVELMEKYPDSPQAAAIRERLDQLKSRAGVE
jgi:outer membrane protein assembly factor BamD (BamD/ComL family)